MIKVITTVGTSLFTNYMRKEVISSLSKLGHKEVEFGEDTWNYALKDEATEDDLKDLKTKIASFWLQNLNQQKDKKGNIKYVRGTGLNVGCCAEVQSLIEIQREQNVEIQVFLLATDTQLSKLACVIIENIFNNNADFNIKVNYNEQIDTLKGLKIDTDTSFREGQNSLITRFYQICESYFGNVILNVTGGYKGLIPFLTILGQINKVPIKYIYEDTGILHTIPVLPIDINENLFEQYYSTLSLLENETLDTVDYYDFLQEFSGCVIVEGKKFMLNPLGYVLLGRYKAKFFSFYTIEEIWSKIKANEKIYNALKNNFSKTEIRDGHTEKKPSNNKVHRCYDGGRTNPRMFYLIENSKVYIYGAFESHNQEYEAYLDRLNKISISAVKDALRDATLRKIALF